MSDWFCKLCLCVIEYTTEKDRRHYVNGHMKEAHNATTLPYKCRDKNCGCKIGIKP